MAPLIERKYILGNTARYEALDLVKTTLVVRKMMWGEWGRESSDGCARQDRPCFLEGRDTFRLSLRADRLLPFTTGDRGL